MLLDILNDLSLKSNLPESKTIIDQITKCVDSIKSVSTETRPSDNNNLPGGLINLKGRKVVVIPDLHGRRSYLNTIILKYHDELMAHRLSILFLGDFLHTEVTTKERWIEAYKEFQGSFTSRESMDKEIIDNLCTLLMLTYIKIEFPNNIFFLKGNHDNIYNSFENGNRGFRKYAMEGDMVLSYLKKFYPAEVIEKIDKLEKNYGIMAIGDRFIASHAEPKEYYSRDEIINYKSNPKIIYDLTWTRNGDADPSVVKYYIKMYLKGSGKFIAGHRHVSNRFKISNHGLFVQFHNPRNYPSLVIDPYKNINPEKDIKNLRE